MTLPVSFLGLSVCLILAHVPELHVLECLLWVLCFPEINCEAYISAWLHMLMSGFPVFTLPPVFLCLAYVFWTRFWKVCAGSQLIGGHFHGLKNVLKPPIPASFHPQASGGMSLCISSPALVVDVN